MARALARGRRRAVDAAAEDEVGRAIAAVQELRGWRDRVGARAGGRCCRRGWRPAATSAPRAHVARLARVDVVGGRRRARGDRGGAGRRRRACCASDAVDLEAAARRLERAARVARRGDRARRAQARPTRASWPRRRRRSSQAERDKLAAPARGAATAL